MHLTTHPTHLFLVETIHDGIDITSAAIVIMEETHRMSLTIKQDIEAAGTAHIQNGDIISVTIAIQAIRLSIATTRNGENITSADIVTIEETHRTPHTIERDIEAAETAHIQNGDTISTTIRIQATPLATTDTSPISIIHNGQSKKTMQAIGLMTINLRAGTTRV